MLKKLIQNKIIFYITGIFFILIYLLSRTFMGVFILEFRIGEYAILSSMIFLISSIFVKNNSDNANKIFTKSFKLFTALLVAYFIFSTLYNGQSFTNPYIYKASSYIWSLGFIFFGLSLIHI